jgi:hypothetical protein
MTFNFHGIEPSSLLGILSFIALQQVKVNLSHTYLEGTDGE